MSSSEKTILVCYCINGHQVIPHGRRVPSQCDKCGAPMDPNRLFIPAAMENEDLSKDINEMKSGNSAEKTDQRFSKNETPLQILTTAMPDKKAILALDFFGERIQIPDKGGWVGRNGIGVIEFAGNRLISREHVFIKPIGGDKLSVGPDKSLNGVSVTIHLNKSKLEGNQTAILEIGDILWLYNIPLVLVSDRINP